MDKLHAVKMLFFMNEGCLSGFSAEAGWKWKSPELK